MNIEQLYDFLPDLHKQAENTEQYAIKCVRNYFYWLHTFLDEIFGEEQEKQKEQIIQNLESEERAVFELIDGSFQNILERRLSLWDEEHRKILELPEGPTKEEIKKNFGSKVFQEVFDEFCKDTMLFVMRICDIFGRELDNAINAPVSEPEPNDSFYIVSPYGPVYNYNLLSSKRTIILQLNELSERYKQVCKECSRLLKEAQTNQLKLMRRLTKIAKRQASERAYKLKESIQDSTT